MERIELNEHELRALGVLIEKDMTTPDQYPLSLNAATTGCNQKSNRDPVVDYVEAEVDVALQGLVHKGLAGRVMGSRVERFRHNAREVLELGDAELAVLAELCLRGPQAPGELRGRAARMHALATLEALSPVLARLIERGLARRLPPGPGSRVERFEQTLCKSAAQESRPAAPTPAPQAASSAPAAASPTPARRNDLAEQVALLRRQIDFLASSLGVRLPD
jgi:uncharacterized protein YceH (UPF0502 family)